MGETALSLKELGNKALKDGHIAAARGHYLEALEFLGSTSDFSQLQVQIEQNLTLCAFKQHAWEECVDRCKKLIAKGSGDSAKVQYRLARALSELGRKTEALCHIEKACTFEPQDLSIRQLLVHLRLHACDAPVPACKIRIVAMMASHIGNAERLAWFRVCLRSIIAQSHATSVAVSWSAATEALASKTRCLLSETMLRTEVVSREQPRPLSQFEHYRALTKQLEQTEDTGESSHWVIFSDDDDLWHPERSGVYSSLLADSDGNMSVVSAVCPWYVSDPDGRRPSSVEEVNAWLKEGTAVIKGGLSEKVLKDASVHGNDEEYWMYAVRRRALDKFFEDATDSLLACKFCDMAFRSFVRGFGGSAGQTVYIQNGPQSPWMYFYNYHDSKCQKSVEELPNMVGKPLPEDEAAAAKIQPILVSLMPGYEEHFGTVAKISECLALIRKQLALPCCSQYEHLRRGNTKVLDALVDYYFPMIQPLRFNTEAETQMVNWLLLAEGRPLGQLLRSFGIRMDICKFEQACQHKATLAIEALRVSRLRS